MGNSYLPTFFKRVDPSDSRPQDDKKVKVAAIHEIPLQKLGVKHCHYAAND
jgi:hypothetical protein